MAFRDRVIDENLKYTDVTFDFSERLYDELMEKWIIYPASTTGGEFKYKIKPNAPSNIKKLFEAIQQRAKLRR